MSTLLSNFVVETGKSLLSSFSGSNNKAAVASPGALDRFDVRLEYAMSPEKSELKSFLSSKSVNRIEALPFAEQQLKSELLTDPQVSRFLTKNGVSLDEVKVQKTPSGFSLVTDNNQSFRFEADSVGAGIASKVYHLQNVRQLAALQPGLTLNQLIDESFARSSFGSGVVSL